MKYMLWHIRGTYKDRKLKEALDYYKQKYGEPLSVLIPINLEGKVNTELSVVVKKNLCKNYIGITSELIQSEE